MVSQFLPSIVMMQYRLLPTISGSLIGAAVSSYYFLWNEGEEYTYGCVPNGELGISVILRGSSHMYEAGRWIEQPELSVYGLVRRVQFHRMSPGYREFNIGFRPEQLRRFLPHGMTSLLQREATSLDDLFGRSEVERLHEACVGAANDQALVRTAEDFLQRHMQKQVCDPRIQVASALLRSAGDLRMEEVCTRANLSMASLRRLFHDQVGMAPKELQRLHRVRRALGTDASRIDSLTDLGLSLGYFDQAHFNHEFKQAVGLSPGAYFGNATLVSDFYKFGRWSAGSFAADERP